jgi:hypothetical protein
MASDDTTDCTMTVWTVYHNPKDYPDKWVLRGHDVPGGARQECFVADTLDAIRMHVPIGCICLARQLIDDPVIYETWV